MGRVPLRLVIALLAVLGLMGAGLVVIPAMMMMGIAGVEADDSSGVSSTMCSPIAQTGNTDVTLGEDQLANAQTVIETGVSLEIPARGLVVAVATAMQESTLQNLSGGDRDSMGLFQQRGGWGSASQRTDPVMASTMFYTGGKAGQPGLLDIDGWQSMTVTDAAQAVQRSAFPFAYARWESLATSLVESVVGDDPLGCDDNAVGADLPDGAVGDMLQVALEQQGDPYVWGAVGPDSFDCSGLVVYSWRQAGHPLKIRTAAQMYDNSTHVEPGDEQPGDLLFGALGERGSAGHVMIVLEPGTAVQAPETGRDVQITKYTADDVNWKLGRLDDSAFARTKPAGAAA
ncbi:C40 family peptidase [Kineosporia sp. J2-2]|uniref:C40 family peptidase n=1 Tax=Kineosporia corallincola TaxID=2835133 RepID=A0ABS5T8C7_9ACTN|nr:C40 family peptidase [Kineosporia corallincola]MBT0767295.1 C40 family peptidase [Kineosporia corallincola]